MLSWFQHTRYWYQLLVLIVWTPIHVVYVWLQRRFIVDDQDTKITDGNFSILLLDGSKENTVKQGLQQFLPKEEFSVQVKSKVYNCSTLVALQRKKKLISDKIIYAQWAKNQEEFDTREIEEKYPEAMLKS